MSNERQITMKLAGLLSLLLTCSLYSGCGNSLADTYSVKGIVRYEDQPLTGGTVLFEPIKDNENQKSFSARGNIGPDGSYQLSTFVEHDGAAAGNYRVAVIVPFAGSVPEYGIVGKPMPAGLKKYISVGTSPLRVTVNSDPQAVYDLHLTAATIP